MRPVQLIMNDFGPYKGKNVIDFSSIQNALFLISGPTGAGKTFIFDAICFALYGKLSGDTRKEEDIRSMFASPDSVSYVEFTFDYQGHEYVIYREPAKQLVAAKRKTKDNQGLKEKTAEYFLKKDNTTLFTKKKEMDEYIKSLLCLDYQQFKMTMMIAQGDFYRLITADTDTRKEIFRQILNTVSLDWFTSRLGDLAKEKSKAMENIEIQLTSAFQHLKLNDEVLMKEIMKKDAVYALFMDQIEESIAKDEEQLKVYQEQEKELQKELQLAKDKIAKAKEEEIHRTSYQKHLELKNALITKKKEQDETLLPQLSLAEMAFPIVKKEEEKNAAQKELDALLIRKENIENELQTLLKKKEKLKPQLSLLQEEEKKIGDLLSSIHQLEQEEKALTQYLKLKNEVETLEENKKSCTKEKDEIATEIAEIEKSITEIEAYLEKQDFEKEKQDLLLKKQEITKEMGALKKLEPTVKTYDSLLKELESLQLKIKEAYEEEQMAMSDYQRVNHLFLASLSASLAKELKENEPCPVCGSLSHPHLAIVEQIITEEEKNEAEKVHKEKEKIYMALASNEQALLTKIQTIKEQIMNALNISEEDDIHSQYQKQYRELESHLKNDIESRLNEIIRLEKEKSHKKEECDALKDKKKVKEIELDNKKQKLDKVLLSLASKQGELSSLEKGLSSFDLEVIRKELKAKKEQKENYDSLKEVVDKAQKELETKEATLNGQLSSLIEQKEKMETKIESLEEELATLLSHSTFESLDDAHLSYLSEEKMKEISDLLLVTKTRLDEIENILKEEQEKGYDTFIPVDITPLNEEATKIEQEKDALLENKTALANQIENNRKELIDIHKIMLETKSLQEEYQEINALYKTAKGDLGNANKICFEVYYQQQVFAKVLEVASQKFNQMSGGRYTFARSLATSKKKQSGLEINVIDCQYGNERSASSLSGGESFQASLSLALSFSEVIQAYAGGIELNSMFIDEGFGTLDEDMLRTTEKTLMGISNSTDRLVGIISHIDELQESIPSKIVVTKTDHGSKVRVEND